MKTHIKISTILIALSITITHCEKTPEGIYNALFDDIAAEDIQLQLSMPMTNDVYLNGEQSKANNNMANWGELIYFDATLSNPLPDAVEDVELQITGVNNTSHIVDWLDDRLDYGTILANQSGVADEYLCLLCGELEEFYLGRTWVETNSNNFGTASITLEIQITFDFRGTEYTQESTHTFTIFP